MNKKLIAIAVASVFSAPMAAQAASGAPEGVSGFADIVYTMTNDNAPENENRFAVDGEVDFVGKAGDVSVRVDLDLPGAALEQAYFAAPIGGVTLMGGIFNSPLTAGNHDAPDMDFTTHHATYSVAKNVATADLAGVAIAGAAGMLNYTVALVNDPGFIAADLDASNSIALVLNATPSEGLDLELGYFTQEDDALVATGPNVGAGNILDINATYTMDALTAVFDYAVADNGVDSVYTLWGGYQISDVLVAKVRIEGVAFEAAIDDTTATTLFIAYTMNENLTVALEVKDGDNLSGETASSIDDGALTTLELIATF